MINYQKAIKQAKENFADLMERGEDAIGDDWEDVRKELFTAEELTESDFRVAAIRELIGVNKMIYEWKYPLAVPAQVAGEYLADLEQEKGELTPELVLNESRPAEAVLHSCFEWDDEKAAEGYRLYQARRIINNITVKIEENKNEIPQNVRAFVSVTDVSKQEKGSFITIQNAMLNTDYKKQVLRNALWELKNFKNKYSSYKELGKIFASIDELEKEITEQLK